MTKASIVFLVFFSTVLFAEPKTFRLSLDSDNTIVEFLATGSPGVLKIQGRTSDEVKEATKGTFTITGRTFSGDVTYQVKALTTGIRLRDKHMHEKYLESGKYPTSQFKIEKFDLPAAFIDGDFEAKKESFSGQFTLKDVTKPVKGTVDIERKGKQVEMIFTFPIQVSDFKIANPGFMSVTMANEVAITAAFKAQLEAAPAKL